MKRRNRSGSLLSFTWFHAIRSAGVGSGFAAWAASNAAIRASASLRSGLSENCTANRFSAFFIRRIFEEGPSEIIGARRRLSGWRCLVIDRCGWRGRHCRDPRIRRRQFSWRRRLTPARMQIACSARDRSSSRLAFRQSAKRQCHPGQPEPAPTSAPSAARVDQQQASTHATGVGAAWISVQKRPEDGGLIADRSGSVGRLASKQFPPEPLCLARVVPPGMRDKERIDRCGGADTLGRRERQFLPRALFGIGLPPATVPPAGVLARLRRPFFCPPPAWSGVQFPPAAADVPLGLVCSASVALFRCRTSSSCWRRRSSGGTHGLSIAFETLLQNLMISARTFGSASLSERRFVQSRNCRACTILRTSLVRHLFVFKLVERNI